MKYYHAYMEVEIKFAFFFKSIFVKIVLLLSFYASVHKQADRPYQVTRESILPDVNSVTPANCSELSGCAQKLVIAFWHSSETRGSISNSTKSCSHMDNSTSHICNMYLVLQTFTVFRSGPSYINNLNEEGCRRWSLRLHVLDQAIYSLIPSCIGHQLLTFVIVFTQSHRRLPCRSGGECIPVEAR